MLIPFQELVALGLVKVVDLVDVKVVVCKDLTLVNVLPLIDVEAIHIEREFFPKALLDLLHLSVVPEREVIDCVREFQWAPIHVKLLNDGSKSMS